MSAESLAKARAAKRELEGRPGVTLVCPTGVHRITLYIPGEAGCCHGKLKPVVAQDSDPVYHRAP